MDVTPSIEGSDKKGRKTDLKRVKKPLLIGKGKKRAFDLSMNDDSDDDERGSTAMNGANETNGLGYDEGALLNDDESLQISPENESQSGDNDLHLEKKRKGSKLVTSQGDANEMKPPPRPKGRPSAKPSAAKPSAAKPSAAKPSAAKPSTAKPSAAKPSAAKTSAAKPEPAQMENGRFKSRSVFTARSETPAGDNGAVLMKTGRTSIKPVAFWRNERVVYGDGNLEGQVLTLPGIKEVIRTDEIEVPWPKKPTSRRSRPKREQEDKEREPWEIETGIMRARVMQWDPVIGRYDEDNTDETGKHSISYSRKYINGSGRSCICCRSHRNARH